MFSSINDGSLLRALLVVFNSRCGKRVPRKHGEELTFVRNISYKYSQIMAPLALLRKAIYDAAAISYKKTINMANLRPIANINVQFDPFHERSTSAR